MKKFKLICTVLLFVFIGALIVRVIISTDKSVYKSFVVSDDTKAVYAEKGEVTVRKMDLKNMISEFGYFSAYSMYFVEETGEVQVTVRYNNSALGYTDTESHDDFAFRLLIRDKRAERDDNISLGGEENDAEKYNKQDILYGGTYYEPVEVEEKSRYGLYQYRRLTFKGVDLKPEELLEADMLIVMTDKNAELIEKGSASSYSGYFDRQYIHKKGVEFDPFEVSEKKLNK